ncbi:hypothetical protein F2Q69_00032781 [Brassica cretica]|uniref:Uncharacterized protein n=1 Tax=Brassica cretica TaxID=69181 RepID=A0A8S9SA38_BRACR|nr:hypothetical protein F2Q69_00032781 [Brassica cretica]
MEYVEAFLSDFSVDDLLDLSNTDAFVREKSSSSPREEEREKANSSSDQITLLSPLDDILSLPGSGSKLNVPVSPLAFCSVLKTGPDVDSAL